MPLKRKFRFQHESEEARAQKTEGQAHSPPVHDESNWLVSYADMMTLLCGFFIMMFSMARLDEPKYESVKAEIAKAFGGIYQPPHVELAKFITQVIQETGLEKDVQVKNVPAGISIIFQSIVFFDTLSAEIRPEGKVILDKLIQGVMDRQVKEKKDYKIVVEGHTDHRPIIGGIYPSNWELAGARATRVVRIFRDQGFAPDHLTAMSYADTRPVEPVRLAAEMSDEMLAKNRRVVIRILEPRVDAIPME